LSSPSPAYTREILVLNIQDRDDISVYAIIAKDDAGNAGQLSNIVSVKLLSLSSTGQPSITQSPTTPSLNPLRQTAVVAAIVIGSVCVSSLIIMLIIVIHKNRTKKSKKKYVA